LPGELAEFQGIVGLFDVLKGAMEQSVNTAGIGSATGDPFAGFGFEDDMQRCGTARRFTEMLFSA
jgi:hypothetical protein